MHELLQSNECSDISEVYCVGDSETVQTFYQVANRASAVIMMMMMSLTIMTYSIVNEQPWTLSDHIFSFVGSLPEY